MNYTYTLLLAISLILGCTAAGFGQNETITGTVTDESTGNTLPGVNILVKGTTTGTSTDQDGRFELEVSSLQDTLVVSFIGYQTREVPINNRSEIDISLDPQAIAGEELVVVGYGEQEEVNLTGSVDAVDSEQLTSRPATNVTSLLQGQMSGVTITQSSGQPGQEEADILIRGLGTMNNAQPMVVVDGLETTIEDVNPNDIESVSVLKDAAAAAIYGTRAANGVILITTKRGSKGAPKISYNTYFGWQQATRLPDYLSSADYARLLNEANRNEGQDPRYSEEEIRKFETGEDRYSYPNTDWLEFLLQGSGFTQNHNLGFSGGNETSRYRVSLGYNEQFGLLKKANSDRYNLRVNLDSEVTEWFDLGLNIGLSRQEIVNPTTPYSGGTEGTEMFFVYANRIPPVETSVKKEDGSWGEYLGGNPIAWIEEGGRATSKNSHAVGSIFGEITLAGGLSLQGTAGLDYTFDDSKTHVEDFTYSSGLYEGPNSVEDRLSRTSITSLEALLTYKERYGNHGISGLLGISRRSEIMNYNSAYRRDLPSNELSELTVGSRVGWTNDGNKIESKLGSYFGRINYDYNNRYLFEANLRRDGSSKFTRDRRWGWFPSFSVGWRLTEEYFMEAIHWLEELKLRGSWGKLGNHRIGDYQYTPLVDLGQNYSFDGTIVDGVAQTAASNADISWEVATELNIGIDAGLFQNLFSITADYYNRLTEDILTNVPVSTVFGLPAPTVNAGAMRNRGVELQVEHNNSIDNFQYNVAVNGAYNKNEVEKYENPSTGDRIRTEGEAWDSFYGYEWIGYFQTDEEAQNSAAHKPSVRAGDLKFKDQNGDGTINGDDRVVLGNPIPEITFGFNAGARYKGVDFSVLFQGADQVYRRLYYQNQWPLVNGYTAQEMHLDRMIVENGEIVQEGLFPRTRASSGQDRPLSSFAVHDAAYIRLKNLQVGYTLPASWMNKIQISNARIYFSGRNLLTITRDFPGTYDPETASGQGGAMYPQVEIYTFGLDITF